MLRINFTPKTLSVMRWTFLITVLVTASVFLAACGSSDDAEKGESVSGQLYSCGMHPQVIAEEPGNCPICGMNLTPIKRTTPADGEEHEHAEGGSVTSSKSTPKVDDDGKENKKILYWQAPMNPSYISDTPGKSPMGMDLIPVYEGEGGGSGSTISIDPVTVQNTGVRFGEVTRQPFNRIIRTVGHVDYNEEGLYSINIKFPGWIEKLYVERTGDLVKKGQRLFRIYSPELVSTQEEYLLAYNNQKKLQSSNFKEISFGAQSLLAASRQRLKFWDISDKEIAELEKSGKVRKDLTIYSPADGIVIHKNAIEGSYIKAGMDLYQIANLSTVWIYAHVFEYELPWIKAGQTTEMELPYIPGKKFKGTVDYIYPYLDAKTRDVKIRLVFDNPALELKPQMYANIMIKSSLGDNILVIPSEAILRTGQRNLVFLDLGGGKFRPQDVVLGPEGENHLVSVKAGLVEGQRIVTSAQFLLDSESRLQEAIQKMLEAKRSGGKKSAEKSDDMQGHEMTGDEMKMDETQGMEMPDSKVKEHEMQDQEKQEQQDHDEMQHES